jgi:hypothetical protein
MKFSLFLLEKAVRGTSNQNGDVLLEECCIHLETYNTLDEAQIAQKEYKQKTIILPSY